MRYLKAVLFLFVLAMASEACAQQPAVTVTNWGRTNNRQSIWWSGNWVLPANTVFLNIEGQWRNGPNGVWYNDFYPTYPALGQYRCQGGDYTSPNFVVQVRSRMRFMDYRGANPVQAFTAWTAIRNVP